MDASSACGVACEIVLLTPVVIAEVVVGALNLDECPIAPMVPVFLVVCGIVGLVKLAVDLAVSCALFFIDDFAADNPTRIKVFNGLTGNFALAWLIVGTIFVYGKFSAVDYGDGSSKDYCDRTAYEFAFVVLTMGWVSVGIGIVAATCACCINMLH